MIEIRSYRRVFDLERRIYRLDRLRLNPSGIPVRGVVYAIALLILSTLSSRLPMLGGLAKGVPWYIRDVAIPCAGAACLTAIRVEGRNWGTAAWALARFGRAPRRLAALRPTDANRGWWLPEPLLMLLDGSERACRVRYRGPGVVRIAVEHQRTGTREAGRVGLRRLFGRRRLVVRERAGGIRRPTAAVIELHRKTTLVYFASPDRDRDR